MTVVGIAVQRLDMGDELSPGRTFVGGGDADLAAELIGLAGLAFADTLDFGRVQGIDLGVGIAPLLGEHPLGQPEGPAEGVL